METKSTLLIAVGMTLAIGLFGKENIPGFHPRTPEKSGYEKSACAPASAKADLDINNVRTKIMNGGDMWWDLISAKYEVPKGGGVSSIFAGGLWIGGVDDGGQLKMAAMTYRQTGVDYWPGPLDQNTSVDANTCSQYDKLFPMTRSEVEKYLATGVLTDNMLKWPGNGYNNQPMAPYYDANGNGIYDPGGGDYPDYDITGTRGCAANLYGDQTLWWVFNDRGNIHTETGGNSIGLEVQAQAFSYATNDEINNMTFYKYKIINRSTYKVNNTWFGQWVDPDLGYAFDDFVGCDVGAGLGYCYNGKEIDGTGAPGQYGAHPPAIGIDFFQGPLADPGDGIDNNRDGRIDEPGEEILMSQFVYYNNDNSGNNGNPSRATDYYNYLRGIWRDGTHMTYGGAGTSPGTPCDFMFPGDSDPAGWGTSHVPQSPWSEITAGDTPGDRRFLESAGHFTLLPGAVNYITTGAVWARTTNGTAWSSVLAMKVADVKAQALFNNCFKILDGPTAPDLTLRELDKQLVFCMTNTTGNNVNEAYKEKDPYITHAADTLYHFQGYELFQLKDASVGEADLLNPDKARLAYQCDMKDGISQIVNYYYDLTMGAWVPVQEVAGQDKGIQHTFNLTTDLFATGDSKLVNYKQYYYMIIAYAYSPSEVNTDPYHASDGLNLPFLAGRKNIKVYTAIPHNPSEQAMGTLQTSNYGNGPKLTRIEGKGNGGNVLDLTPETVTEIMNSPVSRSLNPVYQSTAGPVTIKVIDPLNVPNANYVIKLNGVSPASGWKLTNVNTGQTITSDRSIQLPNEQVIPSLGLSVTVSQVLLPGDPNGQNNGFADATMSFTDDTRPWLTGIADQDGATPYNWIRSGSLNTTSSDPCVVEFNDYFQGTTAVDPNKFYEHVLGGTWAPYRLCEHTSQQTTPCYTGAPAWELYQSANQIKNTSSIDVVITNDPSKWTRCPVLEMSEISSNAEGGAPRFDLRRAPSVDKHWKNINTGGTAGGGVDNSDYISATGMSWFPGYAINVETGERLNMAFGEDSWLSAENGRDMKWNPTSTEYSSGNEIRFGGKHYIYVFGHNADRTYTGDPDLPNGSLMDIPRYDAGSAMMKLMSVNGIGHNSKKMQVFKDAMWVNIPMLAPGHQLMETDVKIRLRVSRPYEAFLTTASDIANPAQNANNPMYTFSTADLHSETGNLPVAKNALAIINVVPNPYYAYSAYETNQLDNRVKITNLPGKCTISIYTISGTLVRRFTKDDALPYLDWDLKNTAEIPIASGLYLIHIKADGVGERILKWFGVMRPIDLDSF